MSYGFDLTKLSQLTITNFSNGGPAVLDEVRPSYEYQNNQRTDKVNGLKVSVVFPANRYQRLSITVADSIDRLSAVLDKTPVGTPVLVLYPRRNQRVEG